MPSRGGGVGLMEAVTDETGIRAFWREYLRLMTTGEMPAA